MSAGNRDDSDKFGAYFKYLRRRNRVTLRTFCKQHGFDPGNMSKMERGLLAPPQGSQKLEEYADALGLEHGSDEWREFFDRAAAATGRIPSDILSDEELVKKLPLVFRTIRGEQISSELLDSLAEDIRRA